MISSNVVSDSLFSIVNVISYILIVVFLKGMLDTLSNTIINKAQVRWNAGQISLIIITQNYYTNSYYLSYIFKAVAVTVKRTLSM